MAERMTEKTIPLFGTPQQRQQGTGDQRFVNLIFEKIADTDEYLMCVKRPGRRIHATMTVPGTTSTGRGIYAWGINKTLYTVFGNTLFAGTQSTLSMNTSTGRVWFAETNPTDTSTVLIVSDGLDNYALTTSNVTTRIDETVDANFPVNNLGPVFYLDGYLIQATSSGRIYNSDVNRVTSWSATGFETIDKGSLEAIFVQKDQILAFGKNRTETYFNNGNPTGSPFLRIDQNTIDVGIAAKNSLSWSGETACYVSESEGNPAKRTVVRIDSLKSIKDISTPVINRFLQAEGDDISSCQSWMAPVAGQTIYGLYLISANRSFMYNVDNNTWTEWTNTIDAGFNIAGAATLDGVTYAQDAGLGQIYTLNVSSYNDMGTSFRFIAQTQRMGFGTMRRKYMRDLEILGDTTTATVSAVAWDDDYVTSSLIGTIDMSTDRKRISRLGSFQNRSLSFESMSNAPLRLQLVRTNIDEGKR